MLKNKLKGGIEMVIALVIIVGIVIVLIIKTLLPTTDQLSELGKKAVKNTGNLTSELGGSRIYN